jgi:hypothetical protein
MALWKSWRNRWEKREVKVTDENQSGEKTDYAALAAQSFDRLPAARAEGGDSGLNDFDLAYSLAKQTLAELGSETDTNALFFALTAESQKRMAVQVT